MIREFIKAKKATMLCSGPMSKNCIDAAIELSNELSIPQILIASRRQIDSSEFGGGYVENFDTHSFANYVRSKKSDNIFIARDHGGPWQSLVEQNSNLNVSDSMKSAKKSFETDILSGFDFIHIDPSIPIQNENLTIEQILSRLFELYGYIYEFAKQNNRNIEFELGTEEQNGYAQDLEKFEYFLNEVQKFCIKNKVTKPTFVVAQTGTKVMEMQNIGIFGSNLNESKKISLNILLKTLEICNKFDVLLKEHNTDYLSDEALALRPIIGIHASNVAPEFGVIETKALLYILKMFGYDEEINFFIQTALNSNKWKKWMLKNSKATDIDKAIICGHYIFANESIKNMRDKVSRELIVKNIDLDNYLKRIIKQAMTRYIRLFKMV